MKRLRRLALACAGIVGLVMPGLVLTQPAAAVSGQYVSCNQPWGYGYAGTIIMGLPYSAPTGTTVAIYLYKSVWLNGAWRWQYQNVMDWATMGNNYGWAKNGSPVANQLSVVAGFGTFMVQYAVWAPNGALAGSDYSANTCTFR